MLRAPLLALGFLTLAACGARTDTIGLGKDAGIFIRDAGLVRDGGTLPDAGREPELHRPMSIDCDRTRPSPEVIPDPNFMNECTAHSDCTAGENGRCLQMRFGYTCTYDTCFSDSDCANVCECGGAFRSDANMCLPEGACRIDADCGANGFCSPTRGDCGDFLGTVGYYCHTDRDECIDDSDCEAMGFQWYCRFDRLGGRWSCSDSQCAG